MVFALEGHTEGLCLRLDPALGVVLLVPDIATSPLTANFAVLSSCCNHAIRTVWTKPDEGSLRPLYAECTACGLRDERSTSGFPQSVIFRRDDYGDEWDVLDFEALESLADETWDVLTSELYLSDLRAALQAALASASNVLDDVYGPEPAGVTDITRAALEESRSRWTG